MFDLFSLLHFSENQMFRCKIWNKGVFARKSGSAEQRLRWKGGRECIGRSAVWTGMAALLDPDHPSHWMLQHGSPVRFPNWHEWRLGNQYNHKECGLDSWVNVWGRYFVCVCDEALKWLFYVYKITNYWELPPLASLERCNKNIQPQP